MLLLVLNTDFMLVLNMLWLNHGTKLLKIMKCICLLLNLFSLWSEKKPIPKPRNKRWNTGVPFCRTATCLFLLLVCCWQPGSWSLRNQRVDSILEAYGGGLWEAKVWWGFYICVVTLNLWWSILGWVQVFLPYPSAIGWAVAGGSCVRALATEVKSRHLI